MAKTWLPLTLLATSVLTSPDAPVNLPPVHLLLIQHILEASSICLTISFSSFEEYKLQPILKTASDLYATKRLWDYKHLLSFSLTGSTHGASSSGFMVLRREGRRT